MISKVIPVSTIKLPLILGEFRMIEFNIQTLDGLINPFKNIAKDMLRELSYLKGKGFFTLHGKELKKGQTLRRPGPHIDGNYEPYIMNFNNGGGGWKVGEDGPKTNTKLHKRQYENPLGGIILCSNYSSCLGYIGEYDGMPNVGGDCSHIELNEPFILKENIVYYGNNHFIHESLPVSADIHRVFARITLPEDHKYENTRC